MPLVPTRAFTNGGILHLLGELADRPGHITCSVSSGVYTIGWEANADKDRGMAREVAGDGTHRRHKMGQSEGLPDLRLPLFCRRTAESLVFPHASKVSVRLAPRVGMSTNRRLGSLLSLFDRGGACVEGLGRQGSEEKTHRCRCMRIRNGIFHRLAYRKDGLTPPAGRKISPSLSISHLFQNRQFCRFLEKNGNSSLLRRFG